MSSSTVSHSLGAPSAGVGSCSVLFSLQEHRPVWAGKQCHSNWMGNVPLPRCRLLAEGTQEQVCSVQTSSKPPAAVMLCFNTEQQEGDLKMVEQAKTCSSVESKKVLPFYLKRKWKWMIHALLYWSKPGSEKHRKASMLLRNKIGCKKSESCNLFQVERKVQVIVMSDVSIWSVGVYGTLFLEITVMD